MARDMPEPCELLSLDSCQKRFIGAHTEVDLAPHLVVDFMLQVGDAEKVSLALGFKSQHPFLSPNDRCSQNNYLSIGQ